MRRWRVGAADAVRGRGLFVLGGVIGTKEVVGGGGCSAGRQSLSATRGSAPCADPLGCPNTHSQHRLDSWQRPSVVKMGSRGMGAQGTAGVRFIGGETEAEPQRLFPIRLAVIARCGLVRPGPLRPPCPPPPPQKENPGQEDLIFLFSCRFFRSCRPLNGPLLPSRFALLLLWSGGDSASPGTAPARRPRFARGSCWGACHQCLVLGPGHLD